MKNNKNFNQKKFIKKFDISKIDDILNEYPHEFHNVLIKNLIKFVYKTKEKDIKLVYWAKYLIEKYDELEKKYAYQIWVLIMLDKYLLNKHLMNREINVHTIIVLQHFQYKTENMNYVRKLCDYLRNDINLLNNIDSKKLDFFIYIRKNYNGALLNYFKNVYIDSNKKVLNFIKLLDELNMDLDPIHISKYYINTFMYEDIKNKKESATFVYGKGFFKNAISSSFPVDLVYCYYDNDKYIDINIFNKMLEHSKKSDTLYLGFRVNYSMVRSCLFYGFVKIIGYNQEEIDGYKEELMSKNKKTAKISEPQYLYIQDKLMS